MNPPPAQPVTVARLGLISRALRGGAGLAMAAVGLSLLFSLIREDSTIDQTELMVIGSLALVFLWPGLCLVVRNLHAFRIQPVVTLSPSGIHVRKWRNVGLAGCLLPYHRVDVWDIPWNAYQGAQVFTESINGVPHSKELLLFTERGKLSIPWSIFNLSVERLQGAILDYREIEFRLPQRIAAGLAEFQRRRFAEPAVFHARATPFWLPAGLVALMGGLTLHSLGLEDRKSATELVIWTWLVGLILTGMAGKSWWRERGQSRIELRADGLLVAAAAGAGRPVPWEDVLFARACTKSSHWGYGARNENDPGVLEAVEVRLAGGRSLRICAPSAQVLDRLHGLLEPPLDRLLVAKQRIAAGDAIESAAKAAGLVTRA